MNFKVGVISYRDCDLIFFDKMEKRFTQLEI